MRPGKFKIGILFVAAILTGCAVGPMFKDAIEELPAIKSGQARIFVYRNSNPLLVFSPRLMILDGKPVADVYYGTSLYIDIKAGIHTITYNNPPEKLKFIVPDGKAIYLEYFITAADNADKSTGIRMIEQEQAEADMANSFLVEARVRKFMGIPEEK